MRFEPNWNTDAVFHHLAPQTYMRAWKHIGSSVYYILKDDSNIKDNWNRNTKSLAGVDNFFSRRAGALFKSERDCNQYFEPLKDYTVEFKQKLLDAPLKLNQYYRDFDEWVIYDSNSNIVSEDKRIELKKSIDDIHIRDIEVGWARLYEDKWPSLRDDILNSISSNQGASKIPSIRREELVNFMVSMEWRTKPTHPELLKIYEELVGMDLFEVFINEAIPENERMYPFIDTEKENILHNILLSTYHNFLNKSGSMHEESERIIHYMNIELLIAEKNSQFVTSDNPVCRFTNSDNQVEYIFPISPEVACTVRKGNPYDENHFLVSHLDKLKVFEYNQKLKENCYKGYILREPDLSYYFK